MEHIEEQIRDLGEAYGAEKILEVAAAILKPVQGQPGPNTLNVEAAKSMYDVVNGIMDVMKLANEAANTYKEAYEVMARATLTPKPQPMVPLNHNNIQPHNLDYVNDQLESASQAVQAAAGKLSQAMEGRAEVYKAISRLETQVKLDESEAIMGWEYEGGKPVATVNGQRVPMSNDTVRDAFRRTASKESRLALAEKQAEARGYEMNIAQAKQDYDAAVELLNGIRAKAANQAALLNFLARR